MLVNSQPKNPPQLNVSSNTVVGDGALLWQLNATVSYEQYSAILENNTYVTAVVDGSVIPE